MCGAKVRGTVARMSRDATLEQLWDTAPRTTAVFDPARVAGLPAAAQRYLLHALAPGAPLASAVRLTMHGTIRLKASWYPFTAEQVIRWDRGFVWRATVKMHGLPITGSDRLVDGEGAMRWRMLGLVPIVTASGPEIARSAAGRVNAEAIWLPGVLLADDVRWGEHGSHAEALLRAHGEASHLDLELDERGAIRTLALPRWGDPDGGGAFHYETFGGHIDEERTFAGVTVPTQFRLGWFWGTDRFASEGEFFRATIDALEHR